MAHNAPPIAKLAERLWLGVENAVGDFARRDKYRLGDDLRTEAANLRRLINRAWRDQAARGRWLSELIWGIDEIKFTLQMCSQRRAFRSFAQFEQLIRDAEELGMQAGAWLRAHRQHPKGQNRSAVARHERAQTLGTPAASIGANA